MRDALTPPPGTHHTTLAAVLASEHPVSDITAMVYALFHECAFTWQETMFLLTVPLAPGAVQSPTAFDEWANASLRALRHGQGGA